MKFLMLAAAGVAFASDPTVEAIQAAGGDITRDASGRIVAVSLARTWANDSLVERIAQIKTVRRLDLSFTYVTDRGMEQIRNLPVLEELILETAEFITDASMAHLRGSKTLRTLVLRGTDITDVGMPYIGEMTALRKLDLSQTMLGDGGLESLPTLTQLEEIDFGGSRITGINLPMLKLLPKLRKLGISGIQRRNGGSCWTATITDLDLDAVAVLSGLEELNLGAGVGLSREGAPKGGGNNCRATGAVQITSLGVAKLAKLKNLKRLDLSGARLSAAGLDALKQLPKLERLSLWYARGIDDSAAPVLAGLKSLAHLDLSDTPVTAATLEQLKTLPNLRALYLTDTKVAPEAASEFKKAKPACFVSFAQRPAPRKGGA